MSNKMSKGNSAEATIKVIYNKGESGDYTADIMQAVSPTGVVFNGYFNHNGRKHFPDGYIQIGRTMHIFEMKDGAPHNDAHEGQVIRYAHVMNMAMDFDRVITYIIYGSRKEVVIEGYNARDIHVVYAATRYVDDKKYNWQADKYASMSDEEHKAFNAGRREATANRTPEQKEAASEKVRIIKANRTAEQVAIDAREKSITNAINYANRTPEQVAHIGKRQNKAAIVRRANRTPEQIVIDNEKERIRHANRTPEQISRVAEVQRIRHANLTPEQRAVRNEKKRISTANRTPEQIVIDKEKARIRSANITPEQRAAKNKKQRERRAAKKAAKK